MNSFTKYCKSYNLGHRQLQSYFNEPVCIEEKIDGSQFSFGQTLDGELLVRSRGRVFDIHAPDNLFIEACEVIKSLSLTPGYTYRGEYLKKPKHNILNYARIPNNHIILYDIAIDDSKYLDRVELVKEADRLGLEVVPQFYDNYLLTSADEVKILMNQESILGNEPIEGLIFKRRHKPLFNNRDNMVIAKYVSERFKERKGEFKSEAKNKKDILQLLIDEFKTEARWEKAVQHLNENGILTNSPADIGNLIKEVHADIINDDLEYIKYQLWVTIQKQFLRGITRGLPEWYKEKLMRLQFD